MFEAVLSHSQRTVSLLQSMLQLSDFLLQTRGLFLVIIELGLQVTSPGLDQPQTLLQLEIDIFLVSGGLTLSVADQKIGLVANLELYLSGNEFQWHRIETFSLLYLALSALIY